MRVVIILVTVIGLCVILYLTGVGRGFQACIDDCKKSNCMILSSDNVKCEEKAYKACADACYTAHDEPR